MSDHITYRSVASKAIEILHLASNDEEVYFMNRTEDAIRDIDCIQTYINDVCCFDVDSNGRICLPKGFVRPIAIFYTPPPPPLSVAYACRPSGAIAIKAPLVMPEILVTNELGVIATEC